MALLLALPLLWSLAVASPSPADLQHPEQQGARYGDQGVFGATAAGEAVAIGAGGSGAGAAPSEHDQPPPCCAVPRDQANAWQSHVVPALSLVLNVVLGLLMYLATRSASDAANRSAETAETALRGERPLVVVRGTPAMPRLEQGHHVDSGPLRFENVGRSAAVIDRIEDRFHFVPFLDGRPEYRRWKNTPPAPLNIVIAAGSRYEQNFLSEERMPDAETLKRDGLDLQLALYARVTYHDLFGAEHVTRLCWVYQTLDPSVAGEWIEITVEPYCGFT